MVVVAVIGTLAAVTVPTYKKYAAKSRTTEARILLSEIYAARASQFSEWATYASCVEQYGVDHNDWGNSVANSRYLYSFLAKGPVDDLTTPEWGSLFITNSGGNCGAGGFGFGCKFLPNTVNLQFCNVLFYAMFQGGVALRPLTQLTQSTYVAAAYGIVASRGVINDEVTWDALADIWTIDETKTVVHVQVGY
jgi:type IV pilus assembly protein PilA